MKAGRISCIRAIAILFYYSGCIFHADSDLRVSDQDLEYPVVASLSEGEISAFFGEGGESKRFFKSWGERWSFDGTRRMVVSLLRRPDESSPGLCRYVGYRFITSLPAYDSAACFDEVGVVCRNEALSYAALMRSEHDSCEELWDRGQAFRMRTEIEEYRLRWLILSIETLAEVGSRVTLLPDGVAVSREGLDRTQLRRLDRIREHRVVSIGISDDKRYPTSKAGPRAYGIWMLHETDPKLSSLKVFLRFLDRSRVALRIAEVSP